jgi:hypothetical protein
MKKISAASLAEILHKNKLLVAIFSLLLMIAAASWTLFYEKEIPALENKWRLHYQLDEFWGYEDHNPGDAGQLRDLTQYDIKVCLTRLAQKRIEVRFCDRYSFILSETCKSSGVYDKTGQGQGKRVSTAKYPDSPQCRLARPQRSKNLRLRLKCNLIEKTVLVYINGTFAEKIFLGPEPVHYSFGLFLPQGSKEAMLNELEISDPEGRVLFSVNFTRLYFYKLISQAFLSLGVLIFFALGCSERRFFRKSLFFVFPLLFLEAFLRMTYPHDSALDIDWLFPKWRFEISTNFYGTFNNPKELTIRSYWKYPPSTYPLANPEHAMRILCVGSSPIEFGVPSRAQAFPGILEKKLNAWNKKKNMVIPLAAPYATYYNSPELVLYLKDILNKIHPDLILFYGLLISFDNVDIEAQFAKDHAFYQRAKRVMEKNSDWIKNDRLLYAALEFKEPVKEIVYVYNFLCKSYLFMAMENIRKKFLNKWHSGDQGSWVKNPHSFFEELITSCKEKGIKVVFIPMINFSTGANDKQTEYALADFRRKHPESYYLNLEGVLDGNKNSFFAADHCHPSEYGHEVIAQELFRQLVEKGLLNIN